MQTADGHNSRPNLEANGADADGANGRNGASVILVGPFRNCGLASYDVGFHAVPSLVTYQTDDILQNGVFLSFDSNQ